MTLEWRPEPAPEEREALELALARLPAEPPDPRGAWWRAGVEEAVAGEAEPDEVRGPGAQSGRSGMT